MPVSILTRIRKMALHQGKNQKFRNLTVKQHMKRHSYALSMIYQEVLDKNQIHI